MKENYINKKNITLIVPVFNEEENIESFYNSVKKMCESLIDGINIKILFVNDGSVDKTKEILLKLSLNDSSVTAINFSRNFGKENALFAGIEYAKGDDAIIPVDVDLQDPIDIIPQMINLWKNGKSIVLAKRADRESDHYFKRKTAEFFYKTHNVISEIKIPENVGDFRLIDQKVINELLKIKEVNLFMKGVFSWVGFYDETAVIEYKRDSRKDGVSKFNIFSLMNLAIEGITSFSTIPLRVWTFLGVFISLLSMIFGVKIIVSQIIFNNAISDSSLVFSAVTFIGGIQLIGIGVIGEYVGKIYKEAKGRPKYIISEIFNDVN